MPNVVVPHCFAPLACLLSGNGGVWPHWVHCVSVDSFVNGLSRIAGASHTLFYWCYAGTNYRVNPVPLLARFHDLHRTKWCLAWALQIRDYLIDLRADTNSHYTSFLFLYSCWLRYWKRVFLNQNCEEPKQHTTLTDSFT